MKPHEALMLCLVNFGLLAGHPAEGLSLGGSDLLSEAVRTALREELESRGMEAELSFKGSLLGMRGLEDGSIDACLLAVPDSIEMRSDVPRYPLAFQIVALVVDAENPLTELSYRQLADAFRQQGPIVKWGDLTDDPAWRDRNLSLAASRVENTVTLELFSALVLRGRPLKGSIRYLPGSDRKVLDTVIEDPSTLLLAPSMALEERHKYLAIKKEDSGQAYTPTRDNVFFGDYPLRLPFYLVVSNQLDTATLKALLSACYSASVTRALQEMNCLPLPERERNLILSSLD